jgi:hypothetical protein
MLKVRNEVIREKEWENNLLNCTAMQCAWEVQTAEAIRMKEGREGGGGSEEGRKEGREERRKRGRKGGSTKRRGNTRNEVGKGRRKER